MAKIKDLPNVFENDMKIGDEMILIGSHVRITKIELVVHAKVLDEPSATRKHWNLQVNVPMTDFNIPFSQKKHRI